MEHEGTPGRLGAFTLQGAIDSLDVLGRKHMPSALVKRHFDSAEEFLTAIRRSNKQWWNEGSDRSPWVFRGIGDADNWKLLPSAWRTDKNALSPLIKQMQDSDLFRPYDEECAETIKLVITWESAELEALFQFAELANSAGFQVPTGSFDPELSPLRKKAMRDIRTPIIAKPADGIRAQISFLAQHHGVPTRMLDWTENPLVAAFFAASPVSRPLSSSSSNSGICVWALDTDALRADQGANYWLKGKGIAVHRPPRSENLYLHSQGGVFTELLSISGWFAEHGRWPSLEDVLENLERDPPMLVGHVLDASQVPHLAQLLEREGIHSAALMPTLDNVALTVKARWVNRSAEESLDAGS